MSTQANILIVEDREDWRDIVCTAVSKAGYTVHAASSYEEAIAPLGEKKFDLAVVDPVLDMANRFNRDGLSVIQTIMEKQAGISIVILTG